MRRRICTIGPTDVYLHTANLALLLWAWLSGAGAALLTAILSILLHEAAHAAAAALLGHPPQELELTPLGAVMRLEDEATLPPLRRLIMLAAGPAMSLLLCHLALWTARTAALPALLAQRLFEANLAILLLNLLPVLPLDGGRILTLLLSRILRQETVRRIMRIAGTLAGLALIVLSGWMAWRYGLLNWSLAAAGCFLMYSASAATTTHALAQLRSLMSRKLLLETRGHVPIRRIAVPAATPLHRAIRLLAPRALTEFSLMEQGTLHTLAILTEETLISRWLDHPQMNCAEAASTDVTRMKSN